MSLGKRICPGGQIPIQVCSVAAVLVGAGTTLVFPALLAVVGDVAHPAGQARSVGSTGCGVAVDSLLAACYRYGR